MLKPQTFFHSIATGLEDEPLDVFAHETIPLNPPSDRNQTFPAAAAAPGRRRSLATSSRRNAPIPMPTAHRSLFQAFRRQARRDARAEAPSVASSPPSSPPLPADLPGA